MKVKVYTPQSNETKLFGDLSKRTIRIFLAGSIEMGRAENWQDTVIRLLMEHESDQDNEVIVYNPRRDDWDSSWKQGQWEQPFRSQVEWEQSCLHFSDIIFFNFDPDTVSPITLMELGFAYGSELEKEFQEMPDFKKIIVCCPETYFRHGNVAIMHEKYMGEDTFFTSFKSAIRYLLESL